MESNNNVRKAEPVALAISTQTAISTQASRPLDGTHLGLIATFRALRAERGERLRARRVSLAESEEARLRAERRRATARQMSY